MSDWEPMETAPRDGKVILGLVNGSERRIQWDNHVNFWLDFDEVRAYVDRVLRTEPTGWRPFDNFADACRQASVIVSSWPDWKKRVLGYAVKGPHISPNGAEPGSLVHAAEAWLLSQGLFIPDQGKHRHLFQGMLDDFCESDAYAEFDQ